MVVMFISLDLLRIKIEKLLVQFGITEMQAVKDNMVSLTSRNFIYPDAKLIIVDVNSGGFDAIEVISNFRKSIKSKHLPILALGNSTDSSVASKLMKLGCTDYMSKPFDDMTFASKVLDMVRPKENARSTTDDAVKTIPQIPSKDRPIEYVKLTWNASFETGIEAIDDEHRSIVENFEKLYQLMSTGQGHDFYGELLAFLTGYIDTHFANEEAFQLKIGYPHLEDHIKRHQYFREKITAFIKAQSAPISNSDLIKLNLFIKDWLLQHILNEDMKIGDFYKNSHK